MKKSFLSLITALVMVLSLLPSGIAFAEERTYIPEIVATSNIESLLGFGNPINTSTNPTITVTVGAPVLYNAAGTINWYKKDDNGNFKACSSGDTFTTGTYRLTCYFGLYSGDNSTYYLDENTTLTVDGEEWTYRSYRPMSGYEYMVFRSPEFTVHDFTEWHYDETNHWHECPDCGAIQNTATHTPDHEGSATAEYPILCTVCDYEMELQVGHTHSFTQEVVADKYKKADATCHSKAVYYKSCECGRKGTETFEVGDMLPHNAGTEWLSDGEYHWNICKNKECGAVVDSTKAAHIYDSDTDYRCNICKFKREDNRPRISHMEATSDIASILAVGNKAVNPTVTVTVGTPVHYNVNGTKNYYKKDGDSWQRVLVGETFTCGTYKMICHFGLYNYENDTFALSESTNVTVDGVEWSVDSYNYMDYYEYIVASSPEIVIHTPVTDSAVAATCTKTGKTQGSHCSVCGTVITAQKTVAKKAHTYKTYTTKATTSKNGSIVTKCSVCGSVKSKSTIYYPKTITLSTTSYTYNGSVKKPTVKVVGSNGKTISSSNYTVTYASGRKNVGKYAVKITFKGNYSGTKTLTFKINPISVSKCKITLSTTSYTYNGKVKKPTVTVKNANGTKLTTSSYMVTYASGRKNVGTYKVTIKMKGKYSGTKTLTFKINPPKTSVSSLTAGSKKFTVKWKKQATQTTGYQIQYSTSSKFTKSKTVTVSKNSTTSKTISKLSGKKKYYVRVRTYKTVGKAKYYSAWSKAKTVITKK